MKQLLPYAGFLICPHCHARALNLTCLPTDIGISVSRRMFRTNDGKPSPSKHLLTCQHCAFGFTMTEALGLSL